MFSNHSGLRLIINVNSNINSIHMIGDFMQNNLNVKIKKMILVMFLFLHIFFRCSSCLLHQILTLSEYKFVA